MSIIAVIALIVLAFLLGRHNRNDVDEARLLEERCIRNGFRVIKRGTVHRDCNGNMVYCGWVLDGTGRFPK